MPHKQNVHPLAMRISMNIGLPTVDHSHRPIRTPVHSHCSHPQQPVARKLKPTPLAVQDDPGDSVPQIVLASPADAPPLTCNGVQIGPGATPFTHMPFGSSCFASEFT